MTTIVLDDTVRIPAWEVDLGSFRRWTKSETFPDRGWFSHLNRELWVDLSMETAAHNQIKGQIAAVLTLLVVQAGRLGRYFGDRMRLVNETVGLSTEPDGKFLRRRALRARRVRLEEGPDSVEVVGTPDLVLEVVSRKSVQKDTVALRDLYWAAGIPEYWLVNPLGASLTFEILRHTAKGYVPARSTAGWLKSNILGRSFRLTQHENGEGLPEYRLEVR